jgi:hypothetical protein
VIVTCSAYELNGLFCNQSLQAPDPKGRLSKPAALPRAYLLAGSWLVGSTVVKENWH